MVTWLIVWGPLWISALLRLLNLPVPYFLPVNCRYNSVYFIGFFCVLNNLGKIFGTVSRAVVNTALGTSGPGTQTRRSGEVSGISLTVLGGWRSSFGTIDPLGIPEIILCRRVLILHSAIEQISRISSSLACALAFWSLLQTWSIHALGEKTLQLTSAWMCLKAAAPPRRHDSFFILIPFRLILPLFSPLAWREPPGVSIFCSLYEGVYVILGFVLKLNFPVLITKIYIHSLHPVVPWSVFPVKKYTEVWIPSTLECDLIWRQDLVDVIRMRSHWCRVGSPSEMAGILLRRWCNVKTQESHVIDWSYAAARQGMPKMARKPGEVREGQGWIPLQISKGTWSCWHVDFGHLASRTMKQ